MSDFNAVNYLGGRLATSNGFPDPFMDQASLYMPESTNRILRMAEYLTLSNGVYRQAIERVLSYFLTDIEIEGELGDDEKKKYNEFLTDIFGIKKTMYEIGLDYCCYNNAFLSILLPSRRYLACPKCSSTYPFRTVAVNEKHAFKFRWSGFKFYADCPKCHFSGDWGKPVDRRGNSEDVVLKRWSPHEIEIVWDPYTGARKYLWKIPDDYRRLVVEGKEHVLETVEWEVLQAIKDNKYFEFNKDVVHHMMDLPLAGVQNRGWGIPRSLVNFRQMYYVQVLHRYNEALALDYVIPFRVLTPPPAAAGADPAARDPVLNFSMGSFVGRVNSMLRRRRRDPASWNVLPFPLQYQALGGDARNLAPKELLDQGLEVLLNNLGVPVQLYKGDLTTQAAPAALRLFEAQWTFLVHNMNNTLRWIGRKLSRLLSWEEVNLRLMRVTHADDAARQQMLLQLMTSGLVSQTTGLKAIDIDNREETKRKLDEQLDQADQEQKQQDRQQKSMSMKQLMATPLPGQQQPGAPQDPSQGGQGGQPGGDPNAGGQPMAPGAGGALQGTTPNMPSNPNAPISPQDIIGRAQAIASSLISMPDSQRRSELMKLKQSNPMLHSLVKSSLDQMRTQARSTGAQMVLKGQQQQPQQ